MNASDPAAWGGDGADYSGGDAATSGTTVATDPPQDQDRREADALVWLRSVWGAFPPFGYLHGSLRTPGEPWTSTPPMRPGTGPLREVTDPAEALAVVARSWVAASQGADTYVCPYPHALMGRRAGRAVVRRVVHADIDSGPTDMGAVAELGALVVASGSVLPDGHPRTHVYVRLSEPVNAASHAALCAALGAYVGGDGADTSKTGDQDVLRLPGTLNHKTTPPRPVAWLVRPGDGGAGEPWEPDALAAHLGTALVADPEPEPDPPGAVRLSDGVLLLPDDEPAAEPGPAPARPTVPGGEVRHRLEGALRWLSEARPPMNGRPGERNGRLNGAAGLVAALLTRDTGEDPEHWRARLMETARALGLDAAEVRDTLASGWRYGTEHPERVLRDDETRKGPRVHAEPDEPPAGATPDPEADHADDETAEPDAERVREDETYRARLRYHRADRRARREVEAEERAAAEAEARPAWAHRDLTATVAGLLDGTITPPTPTLGPLDGDAPPLWLEGRVNMLTGPSGSGKTWTVAASSARTLAAGGGAVWIDYEDDEVAAVARMLALGAKPDALTDPERFHYVQAEGCVTDAEVTALTEHLGVMLERARAQGSGVLVGVDSGGEALASEPDTDADRQATRWFGRVSRRLGRTGAAVVVLEHVTKALADDPAKILEPLDPIGSQRKRSAINGAIYSQNYRRGGMFSQTRAGGAVLVCVKDRHGPRTRGDAVALVWGVPDGEGGLDLALVPWDQADQTHVTHVTGGKGTEAGRVAEVWAKYLPLLTVLRERPGLNVTAVAEALGKDRTRVSRLLRDAEADGHAVNRGSASRPAWHAVEDDQ